MVIFEIYDKIPATGSPVIDGNKPDEVEAFLKSIDVRYKRIDDGNKNTILQKRL